MNGYLFKDTPPLWVVGFTIFILCLSAASFFFYCWRIYFAFKALDERD